MQLIDRYYSSVGLKVLLQQSGENNIKTWWNQFHALTDLTVSSQKQFSYTSEGFLCPLFSHFFKKTISVSCRPGRTKALPVESIVNTAKLTPKHTAEHRGCLHGAQITAAQIKDTQRKGRNASGIFSKDGLKCVTGVTRIRRWSGPAVSRLGELQAPAARFSVAACQICIVPPAPLQSQSWNAVDSSRNHKKFYSKKYFSAFSSPSGGA